MTAGGRDVTAGGGAETTREAEARRAEVEAFLRRAGEWAARRPDVVALALVGSYARGADRPDSDVDLMVLTTGPARYLDREDWIGELGAERLVATRWWGPVTERRLLLPSGLEVEVGVAPPSWAAVDPVDAGACRVMTDGNRVLYDPAGLLAAFIAAR
ncbi:MAG TPA: nucleotidyltransferase domain-containing protein [Actinomycetes bacterium]